MRISATALPGILAEGDLPADFNALLISLASSAQLALGLTSDPQTKGAANLPQAKHIIDLLGMLEEKTRKERGE